MGLRIRGSRVRILPGAPATPVPTAPTSTDETEAQLRLRRDAIEIAPALPENAIGDEVVQGWRLDGRSQIKRRAKLDIQLGPGYAVVTIDRLLDIATFDPERPELI